MADVELLPLPEPGMLHVGEPREWFTADQMHAYARANMEALRAEVSRLERVIAERAWLDSIHTCHEECQRPACVQGRRARELEAEVELWRHKAAVHQYRRERLAEALRDARRALAFAAQHLPECNRSYERANA